MSGITSAAARSEMATARRMDSPPQPGDGGGSGGGYDNDSVTSDDLMPGLGESVHTAVSSGMASTTFEIERAATITSDNKPHEVTVAVIRKEASSSYYAVPALEAKAYLSARVMNPSEYPLVWTCARPIFF